MKVTHLIVLFHYTFPMSAIGLKFCKIARNHIIICCLYTSRRLLILWMPCMGLKIFATRLNNVAIGARKFESVGFVQQYWTNCCKQIQTLPCPMVWDPPKCKMAQASEFEEVVNWYPGFSWRKKFGNIVDCMPSIISVRLKGYLQQKVRRTRMVWRTAEWRRSKEWGQKCPGTSSVSPVSNSMWGQPPLPSGGPVCSRIYWRSFRSCAGSGRRETENPSLHTCPLTQAQGESFFLVQSMFEWLQS